MVRIVSLLLPVSAVIVAFTASYGVAPIILRKFGRTLNPVAYVNLRGTSAVPLLFAAAAIAERAKPARPQSCTETTLLIVIGFIVSFNTICGVIGVFFAGASIAAVFFMSIPASSTLLAIITRTEPVPPFCEARGLAKIFGIVITVLGAILLVVGGRKSKGSDCRDDDTTVRYDDDRPIAGAILLTAAVIGGGIYFVLTKRFYLKYPRWKNRAISLSAWVGLGVVISLLLTMPIGLIIPNHTCSGRKVHVSWSDLWTVTGEGVYAVEYGAILAACIAMMLMTWSLSKLPASVTSAFMPVGQIIGVGLAAVLLDEKLTALQYGSIILITVGLFLVVWAQYKEEMLETKKQNEEFGGEADFLQKHFDEFGSAEGDQLKLLPMEESTSQRTALNDALLFADHVSVAELDEEDQL